MLGGNEADSGCGETSRISNVGSGVSARDHRAGCLFPAVDTDYAILRRGAIAQSTEWKS